MPHGIEPYIYIAKVTKVDQLQIYYSTEASSELEEFGIHEIDQRPLQASLS